MASYSSSLSILAPVTLDVPRQWLFIHEPQRLRSIVEDRLRVTLTDEYFKFLFPPREAEPGEPSIEEEMREAA
jgi:hypothetical protein